MGVAYGSLGTVRGPSLRMQSIPQKTVEKWKRNTVTELLGRSLSEASAPLGFPIMWTNRFPSLFGPDWARFSVVCNTSILNIHCAMMSQVFNVLSLDCGLLDPWEKIGWMDEWAKEMRKERPFAPVCWGLKAIAVSLAICFSSWFMDIYQLLKNLQYWYPWLETCLSWW